MKHLIILLVFALITVAGVQAQVPGNEQQPMPASAECIMNTSDKAWTAVGLSTEQLEEVKAIQTMCQTDCTALQESGESDAAVADAMIERHRESIRAILSSEQYEKWLAWCSQRPAKG